MNEKKVLSDWDNTANFVTLCDFTLKGKVLRVMTNQLRN